MNKTAKVLSFGCGLLLLFTASGFAQTLDEVCTAQTEANHPEISDVDAACSCVSENADEEAAENLTVAGSVDKLSEGSLEVLRSCGYDV